MGGGSSILGWDFSVVQLFGSYVCSVSKVQSKHWLTQLESDWTLNALSSMLCHYCHVLCVAICWGLPRRTAFNTRQSYHQQGEESGQKSGSHASVSQQSFWNFKFFYQPSFLLLLPFMLSLSPPPLLLFLPSFPFSSLPPSFIPFPFLLLPPSLPFSLLPFSLSFFSLKSLSYRWGTM